MPPGESLANEMEPMAEMDDLKSNVNDILKKVDTFIIDEEDVTQQLNDLRTSNLSNDPFQNVRSSILSSDQFHIVRSSNVSNS